MPTPRRWLLRKGHFIGVDFGTTKSAIGVLTGKQTETHLCTLNAERNKKTMPSVIQLWRPHTSNKENLECALNAVGWEAITQAGDEADQGLSDYAYFERVKLALARDMSKTRMDPQVLERFSDVKPEEVAAILLYKIREKFANEVPHSTTEATITVPANWSPKQRQATKYAAYMAGFEDVELIEEPIAALSYIWQAKGETLGLGYKPEHILAIDFGGGTCDIAVIEINSHRRKMKIQLADGLNELGGELLDQIIVSEAQRSQDFPSETAGPSSGIYWRIRAEELKISLNDKVLMEAVAGKERDIDWATFQVKGARELPDTDVKISAQRLHELLLRGAVRRELANKNNPGGRTVIQAFDDLIGGVRQSARLRGLRIDRVFAVGGSALLYFVKPIILKHFPTLKDGHTLLVPEDPDKCVVRGAALHEKWRWSWRQPFRPKLFFDIEIQDVDSVKPIKPLVKAPKDLPHRSRSDPLYLSKESDEFAITFSGNPDNEHPDDEVYNRISVRTEKGRKILPGQHEIQITLKVSRDGLLNIRVKETKDHVPLVLEDPFPLHKEAIEEARRKMGRKINYR